VPPSILKGRRGNYLERPADFVQSAKQSIFLKSNSGGLRIMRITKALILIFAVFLFGTTLQAQRGRGSGGGMGTMSTPGIGGIGIPASSSPETTTRTTYSELQFNDKLADKLKTLLPQGVDPHQASKGFLELKEFVTTVRAANNLKVPFGELKHKMADGSSKELQKAIHELKPDADAKAEMKKAGEQAKQDIKESKQS